MTKGTRSVHIDAMRGICLVVMTIDHLPWSAVTKFTAEGIGFLTAAEGFFFLSGFVSAQSYERAAAARGAAAARRRFWRRALNIYLYYLIASTLFFLLGELGGGRRAAAWRDVLPVGTGDPLGAWISMALFVTPSFEFAILGLYCLFLPLAPLLAGQLQRGRSGPVLLVSGLLWTVPQFVPGTPVVCFPILAWQAMFVGGMAVGANRPGVERLTRRPAIFWICAAVCAAGFALKHQRHLWSAGALLVTNAMIVAGKSNLGFVRIVNFAAFACAISIALGRWERTISALRPYGWLAFLGQHSLEATICCGALAMLSRLWPLNPYVWLLVGLPSLWMAAAAHARFGRRPAARPETMGAASA